MENTIDVGLVYRSFARYGSYVDSLIQLASRGYPGTSDDEVVAALDGQAARELRRMVPLRTRRRFGAFFTGSKLSQRLLHHSTVNPSAARYYDPCCGMGDLLLAAAWNLPTGPDIGSTIGHWGQCLAGTDLHPEFIEGTKARLVLLAQHRLQLADSGIRSLDQIFPRIRLGNAIDVREEYEWANSVIMNPPFTKVRLPEDCSWGAGKGSLAARVVETAVERVRPGTELLAILPDVLRSGSFSKKWRAAVSNFAEVRGIERKGVFDSSADVDVFILSLKRRETDGRKDRVSEWTGARISKRSVGAHFDVHVGRVVPHRDRRRGNEYAYIHARSAPAWSTVSRLTEKRRHQGRAFACPFLVIRRTSRAGDKHRAIATIVAGKRPVAVENHLIVCEPKDGSLSSCTKLMRQLKSGGTNEFLNRRISCRHLTVAAVAAIPFDSAASVQNRRPKRRVSERRGEKLA